MAVNEATYDRLIDTTLKLADGAAAMTATGYSQVAGGTGRVDLGTLDRMEFDLVIDISALDVATGDESYTFRLVGSNDATPFSTNIIELASATFGDTAARTPTAPAVIADRGKGRWIIPCDNVGMVYAGVDNTAGGGNGTTAPTRTAFQNLRLHVTHVGATSTSITFKAWVAKRG